MKELLFCFLSFALTLAQSQDLAGTYRATFNGDQIILVVEAPQQGMSAGEMTDSYQTYTLQLIQTGAKVRGTATETSLGLQFDIHGQLDGGKLSMTFSIELNGEKNTMDLAFFKEGDAPVEASNNDTDLPALVFPAGATHPSSVAGTWVKEDTYQSGYGDAYMGAGFSTVMTFLPDGHVSEGGSQAYISGSNYSGQSSGQSSGIVPGLGWYVIGNVFYLQVTDSGKTNNVPVGTYYVEGNNMLITASSSEKLLLRRP